MQELVAGQILQGKVKSITPYGAFISIGVGRDGLVHISELADARVEKVEDVVAVGQDVTVKVLEVDPKRKRIALTMRLSDSAAAGGEPRPRRAPEPKVKPQREVAPAGSAMADAFARLKR
jgi:uncharacterized protein